MQKDPGGLETLFRISIQGLTRCLSDFGNLASRVGLGGLRLGDDISKAKLILDSRLPDGSRVAAVIPPSSIHGVAQTLRKFNSRKFKMSDLVEVGTLTAELAEQLAEYVAQRKNILICGGTSSGKTTLANILAELIPNHERIVLIEDTAETDSERECSPIRSPA